MLALLWQYFHQEKSQPDKCCVGEYEKEEDKDRRGEGKGEQRDEDVDIPNEETDQINKLEQWIQLLLNSCLYMYSYEILGTKFWNNVCGPE